MRVEIRFSTDTTIFPKETHKFSLSFIKTVLAESDYKLYESWYDHKNSLKALTHALYLPIKNYRHDNIELKEARGALTYSTSRIDFGIRLYNAFNSQRNNDLLIKGIHLRIVDIKILNEDVIIDNSVTIRFISPLLVREIKGDGKNCHYLLPGDDSFENQLQESLKFQLSKLQPDLLTLVNNYPIRLQSIRSKKKVILYYDQMIDGISGLFRLESHPKIIEWLYQNGMGTRRSAGFGMFRLEGK